jgi:hypothetical protein
MSSAVKISSICRAQGIVQLLSAEEWDIIELGLVVFTTEGSRNGISAFCSLPVLLILSAILSVNPFPLIAFCAYRQFSGKL